MNYIVKEHSQGANPRHCENRSIMKECPLPLNHGCCWEVVCCGLYSNVSASSATVPRNDQSEFAFQVLLAFTSNRLDLGDIEVKVRLRSSH